MSGSSSAQTVYLDLANWIDIAEKNTDRGPFEESTAAGRIVAVLSLTHLLELAAITTDARRESVANYMDFIDSRHPIKWIQHPTYVMNHEALACFVEVHSGIWTAPKVFFDSFLATLPKSDPQTIMVVGQGMPRTIREMVSNLTGVEEYGEYLSDSQDYPDLRRWIVETRNARKEKKRFAESDLRRWLAELLPDQVPMSFGEVAITPELKEQFSMRADLRRCPAFRANWAFHEGANLAPEQAADTDVADLWHLVGAAYCDVAFADKRTVERLRQGRFDRLPRRNGKFRSWLRTLV